jgi:hypothetical protein
MLLSPGVDLVQEVVWPGSENAPVVSPAGAVTGAGSLAVLRRHPALWLAVAWNAALLALAYALAVIGAWGLWRERRWSGLAVCLTPVVYMLAISAGGWAYYRHRVPILPLILVLSASGWQAFEKRWDRS